jgi:hypothetical protein
MPGPVSASYDGPSDDPPGLPSWALFRSAEEAVSRAITRHHDGGGLNERIRVEAGEPGPGGAPLHYSVRVPTEDQPWTYTLLFHPAFSGLTNEALLAVLEDRLRGFQTGPFACPENEDALVALRLALQRLKQRTRDRQARGVLGRQEP